MNRRAFLVLTAAAVPFASATAAAVPSLKVSKPPGCHCCAAWVDHMRAAGFEVETVELDADALAALKERLGITWELAACHTAEIEAYFVEGHVPAGDVKRLLAERPDAAGLTVPGMPTGSPGMEFGGERKPFATLIVDRSGQAAVFQEHR